jgi:hypothetical protein
MQSESETRDELPEIITEKVAQAEKKFDGSVRSLEQLEVYHRVKEFYHESNQKFIVFKGHSSEKYGDFIVTINFSLKEALNPDKSVKKLELIDFTVQVIMNPAGVDNFPLTADDVKFGSRERSLVRSLNDPDGPQKADNNCDMSIILHPDNFNLPHAAFGEYDESNKHIYIFNGKIIEMMALKQITGNVLSYLQEVLLLKTSYIEKMTNVWVKILNNL